MIVGTGCDIADVERVEKLLKKYGREFPQKILSPRELEHGSSRLDSPEYLAGRWAAKEALSKALGTGFGKDCALRDVTILPDRAGRPAAELSGHAAARAAEIGAERIHLSISHEKSYALAFVVLEGFCNKK